MRPVHRVSVVSQTHTHEVMFGETEVRKRFRSWDDGEAEREWACLNLLANHAPGVAPRPLRREIADDGAPVVVMERLHGTPLGGGSLTPVQTGSLGRALRRLYDVPLDAVAAFGITERRGGPSTAPASILEWLREPYEFSACQDPGLVEEALGSALAWLEDGGGLPSPHLAALGIADLNPANVIWDGHACRLIDFEDAGLSDPAFELADHVEHLAGRLGQVYDSEALIEAVGLSDDEHERMGLYRPLWSAFWLAMLLPGNGGFRRNPPGTTEAQARHLLAYLG